MHFFSFVNLLLINLCFNLTKNFFDMKKLSLLLFASMCFVGTMLAQRTISGTLTDQSGDPLIGANVIAKGTTTGTITDFDGTYSLVVPDGSTTLIFSYAGFTTQEIAIGTQTVINAVLSEGLELDEIVVTGLGIKKEKKALGYAVTTIGSSDVQLKPEADIGRILRGKVPGVNITSTSGLAGSGTNVIIRGYSSITGSNQPLFVVDGIPFNSDTNSDRGFDAGGATASSRFLDLDPNQIKEISILKGLSATVLYGEAGRNGVILVTTKNGDIDESDKKFEVSVSQSVFATQVGGVPETQRSYGNGFQNDASNAFSNWGAPFAATQYFKDNINGITNGGSYGLAEDGTIKHPYSIASFRGSFPELVGARIPWEWHDNLNGFFGTGIVNQSSLNITNRLGANSAVNFSYSYLADEGFIPNNNLDKHNIGAGWNTKLANGLQIQTNMNIMFYDRNTPPAGISFNSNPVGASLFSNVLYSPVSHAVFTEDAWPHLDPSDGFSSVYYRSGNDIQHPKWTSENTNDNEKMRRFWAATNLRYDLGKNLFLTYRLGVDSYSQKQRYSINKGGRQIPDGLLTTSERLNFITDQVANINYDYYVTDDINLSGILGINLRKETFERVSANSSQQFIYGLQTHNNFVNHVASSYTQVENTIGVYGTLTAGYKNFLYLTGSARNDWTSTLEKENRSVLYPSASLAFIPTDLVPSLTNGGYLNYLKLRVGYGTSAGYPNPYQTRNVLGSSTNVFVTNSGGIINTNTISDQFGNSDLKPEIITELEVGVEARFLQNKVGLDLSLYDKSSSDLIISLELDPSTGYTNSTINSASMENKGIEIGLNINPISTKYFGWNFTTNFTKNVSKVISIADGIDQVGIAGYSDLGNVARPGEPYGLMIGYGIRRSPDGSPIIGGGGTYVGDPTPKVIGDPNADFMLNFINSFNIMGVTLRAQVDYTQGGDIWSSTVSTLTGRGIAGETDFDRFVPVIVKGVNEVVGADGSISYVPNKTQISSTNHYWEHTGVFYDENKVLDGTTIRLREVSASYTLPKKMLAKLPFGSMSLTFSGQNLWYNAINMPPSLKFDPEVMSLGVGNGQGFEYMTGPTSKKFGGTLNFTF